MSGHSRHRSVRRGPIRLEPLEGRTLLSGLKAPASPRPGGEAVLLITPSSSTVTPQQGSFTVTLTLKRSGPGPAETQPDAVLDHPLTLDFVASLRPYGPDIDTPDPAFTPVHQAVTFPAGVSNETVSVPIVSTATRPDGVKIQLGATPMSSWSSGDPSRSYGSVNLYRSLDAVPPKITGVQPVTQGRLASGLVIRFNRPMAQATVENVGNYRILSRPQTTTRSGFLFWGGTTTTRTLSFPLASAAYDPATTSVTLTLKRPVRASGLYEVAGAYPVEGHVLTDTSGAPLAQSPLDYPFQTAGEFTLLVHPVNGDLPSLVGALGKTGKTDSPISKLNPMHGFA